MKNWCSDFKPLRVIYDSYERIFGHVQTINYFEPMEKSSADLLCVGYKMLEYSLNGSDNDDLMMCKMIEPRKKAVEESYGVKLSETTTGDSFDKFSFS
jgi:hypothetical protein